MSDTPTGSAPDQPSAQTGEGEASDRLAMAVETWTRADITILQNAYERIFAHKDSIIAARDATIKADGEALKPFADIARREELHGSTIGHNDIEDDVRGVISLAALQLLGPTMGEYRIARSRLAARQEGGGE